MSKYKFIGTEQDLIDNGFYLCTDTQDNIDHKDYLRDMNEDVQLYISLGFEPFKRKVVNNKATTSIENFKVEEYIKDLIDLELVKPVEVKDEEDEERLDLIYGYEIKIAKAKRNNDTEAQYYYQDKLDEILREDDMNNLFINKKEEQ